MGEEALFAHVAQEKCVAEDINPRFGGHRVGIETKGSVVGQVNAEKVDDAGFDAEIIKVLGRVEDFLIEFLGVRRMCPAVPAVEILHMDSDEVVRVHGGDGLLGILEVSLYRSGETWWFEISRGWVCNIR